MKKISPVIALLLLCFSYARAQNWVRDMRDPAVNFFTVQSEFNAWWAQYGQEILSDTAKGEGEKGELWKIYRRWEHEMMPRMVATGGVRLGPVDRGEKEFYQQQRQRQNLRGAANWTYIGAPHSFDDGQGDSSAGRVNCVRFDPINHNTIYCGAPTGGLWKSVNFGQSWQLLNTDNLPQIGVSDIAINPQNPNTIYIGTGDIANALCQSIGVLKSTDGGQTWDTTGLSWTVSQGVLIARLLMSPIDSNIMFAATNIGVFKTVDGGVSWNKTYAARGLTGMEFNPLNPNTLYAWGFQLYRSVDTGNTWNKITSTLPDSLASGGFAVGLTPADTSCIYVLVSDTATPGQSYSPYKGVYRSLNYGSTFSLQSTSPDAQGTQGTYDLNISVSPLNEDIVIVAAVNSEFSKDGGVTWTAASFASHVDHHDIRFFNGSGDTVFSANDGGLFISTDTGDTWTGLNNGMHIGELYSISSGAHTPYLRLSGRQDEGTLLQDTSWEEIVSGGDGMECLIDPFNENLFFGAIENGLIGYSTNNGQSINIAAYYFYTGANGPGAWNTPYAYIYQPDSGAALYVAKDYIYKSSNLGHTWRTLNSPALTGSDNLYQLMAISATDPNYIYAATYYKLYRSTDGGVTFTRIGSTLSKIFTSLAVSESNPMEIWVGLENSAGNPELQHSVNAGTNFTSYATGLPSSGPFYAVSIAPVRNSNDALYIGLANAGGVYYRDSTLSSWMPYSTGLPDVTVNQLEVDYCAGKIRAATYGRDLWESAPYQTINVPPAANATFADTGNCIDTVTFRDNSDYNPTAWQWYFPGGQPSSSTAQNPVVLYPAGSTYYVTFIATNSYGSDTAQYAVIASVCTGINRLSENTVASVYPNPNNGNFILSVTGAARGKITMQVLDNLGQNVYENTYNKDADVITTECSLANLAKGIYYLHITTGGGNMVEKLVIDP